MIKMKKQLAVAVTVALLAFPISSALAQTRTPDTQIMVATTATTVQEVAEEAVAAYVAAPITTLAEVELAEGLKAAAVTAVAAVSDEGTNATFELRITNQTTAIATAKAALQVEAAEAAVAAYVAAPITTLAEVETAEGLKAAAVTAVAAVSAENTNEAFELRVTNKAAAIAMVDQISKIYLVSDLKDTFVEKIFMKPFNSVNEAIENALNILGKESSIIYMPHGGSTLPVVID